MKPRSRSAGPSPFPPDVDAARKRLWLKTGTAAVVAFACAAAFSAYLRPDMIVTFGDIMTFCASLLR